MATAARLITDWLALVRSSRARPYLLVTLCLDAALIFVFLVALQSYLPEQHGGGPALPGYALAAYGAAKLLAQIFGGRLTDRLGARRGLFVGLGLVAVGQVLLLGGAILPPAVLPAAAIYGMGGAIVWPSVYALAADGFGDDERARLTSGMTLTTGAALALGLALGFFLPANFPYIAAAAIPVGAAGAALVAARTFPNVSTALAPGIAPPTARVVIRAVLKPQRLGFSLMMLFQALAISGLLAVFRAYGRDIAGVSFRTELLLLAPGAAAGGAAVIIGGALSDRLGRIPVLGTGYLLGALSIWSMSMVSHPAAVVIAAAVAAFGLGMAVPSMSALSMDLSRTSGSGTILGWFMTVEGLGHAGGPAFAGLLGAKVGTAPVFWIAGGLMAGITLVAFVPPIWASISSEATKAARKTNRLVAGALKGSLVVGLALPVVGTYLAWMPSSQVYGHVIDHGPRDQMSVAITFDDGPNPPWTLRIADALDQQGVKGTFFVVGKNAEAHPEIVKELVSRGHLVGNHSFSHKKEDAILQPSYGDLGKAESAIARAAGVCPALFRPPNGFHTPWQLHAVSSKHMHTVTWDVIPRDWKNPPPDVIVQRVLSSVKPGSIILLHDGYNTSQGVDRSATLAAIPGIINGLRAKGYHIVRLDELLSVPAYLPSCNAAQAGP